MTSIILFDAETQHYRQSIYRYFAQELLSIGYKLTIVYDCRLNSIDDEESGLFKGMEYTFKNFKEVIKGHNCHLVISFVWLKYKFLLPFLIYCRLSNIRTIVWSHGINLQNKKQLIKNQFYYARQHLAHALIIFSQEQTKYIKADKKKLFIANNTLNFHELPQVLDTKESLKDKYGVSSKKVILCVARMNVNNRNPEDLLQLARKLDNSYHIIIIGPGLNEQDISQISLMDNIEYLGAIYNQTTVSEYYKLSDIFVMPGAIGLAINQALYFSTPCIVKKVPQGPEAYFLKEGVTGYYYKPDDIADLHSKVTSVLDESHYDEFCKNSYHMITSEGSIENMFEGFMQAIKYVEAT